MTNWLIIKSEKEILAEKLRNTTATLKATAENKEKLELDLNAEIATLSQNLAKKTFKKQRDKKEAQRLAGELKTTQESLKDANDKATNEKADLLKQLKELNEKLNNPLTPAEEDIQIQLDAIKGRLAHILEAERKDIITVLEARQTYYLKELQDKSLILNDQEKKALDYAGGYYYWHSKGDHDRAKADKEALDQYLTDNKDQIKSEAVLFSVSIVSQHYAEEEKHAEDNHKYLKDLTDINNKYAELEAKYKDKEVELVEATDKLKLTQEEKDKISDEAVKKIEKLDDKIKNLTEINNNNQKAYEAQKEVLVGQISQAKEQLKQKIINEAEFNKRLGEIGEQISKITNINLEHAQELHKKDFIIEELTKQKLDKNDREILKIVIEYIAQIRTMDGDIPRNIYSDLENKKDSIQNQDLKGLVDYIITSFAYYFSTNRLLKEIEVKQDEIEDIRTQKKYWQDFSKQLFSEADNFIKEADTILGTEKGRKAKIEIFKTKFNEIKTSFDDIIKDLKDRERERERAK